MSNMSTQWDETHLCSRYNESDCEFFLKTDAEIVFNGKKLDKCCYYCTSENKVRKIGTGGTWTGLSPKFCPKRKTAEKETAEKQLSYIDKLREKYPKISIEDEWLFEDYCPETLFLGKNIPHISNDLCDSFSHKPDDQDYYPKCQKCWNSPCAADVTFISEDDEELKDFEENYFFHYPDEETADTVPEISENTSETDKPKPTYKDILLEHYPDFDESRFDEFACSACVAEYFNDVGEVIDCAGINNNCKICWCSECRHTWDICEEGEQEIKPYLNTPPVPADTEADKSPENQIATTTETALQSSFDYSELDSDTAKNLRECETVIRQETAGYFTILGAKFKEAQVLLADHASGTFEKWYTAMGFKRQTVYNLIQRYDFLGSPTIGGREDTFEALPLTLSYEVSKPDAPAELVEKVLDGDITTNAEYLKLKAELDRTREECRQLDANSAAKDKEYERQIEEANKQISLLRSTIDQKDGEIDGRRAVIGTLEAEKETLEKEIEELQSRPVDVAVQDNPEFMEELEQLREENKRLKDDNVKSFLIRLTMDEYEELLKTVSKKSLLLDAIQHAKIIKL